MTSQQTRNNKPGTHLTRQQWPCSTSASAPCSHRNYHPRAANYVVAVKGNTTTYMLEENGVRLVKEILTLGKATIFPQASMHKMEITGCAPAQLVSALNSDDAGTQNVANVFANGFPSELVGAAMGADVGGMGGKVVPIGTGANWGRAECLAQCGIDTDQ